MKFESKQNKREINQTHEQALLKSIRAVSRLISDNNFNLRAVDDRAVTVIEKISYKHGVSDQIKHDQVMRLALEQIHEEQGIFPENLEIEYVQLLSDEIRAKKQAGKKDYEIIKEIVMSLRKKSIELDNRELEKQVQEIMIEHGAN